MYKLFLLIAGATVVAIILIGVVAPSTPEGSFLHEFGQDVRDSMGAWFGQPVGAD
jgi:hypothetical protein